MCAARTDGLSRSPYSPLRWVYAVAERGGAAHGAGLDWPEACDFPFECKRLFEVVNLLTPTPSFSQPSHSFEMIETMLVRLFRPGTRRSFTRISPSSLACRMAFLTVLLEQPASAAIASTGRTQALAR